MYEEKWGSWTGLFDYMDRLDAVTPADVQQAAQEAFRPGNRVVGILRKPRTQPSASADR